MKTEKILLIMILVSIVLRYVWASVGWGGEFLTLFPVLLVVIALLVFYLRAMTEWGYKVSVLYFCVFIIAIIFNICEWKGSGLLLFIGNLGFILFPFLLTRNKKSNPHSLVFIYALVILILLVVQTVINVFLHSGKMLIIGHVLSYPIVLVSFYCLYNYEVEKDLTGDEKKILTFLIIVNILSLLGITYKDSFYYFLWL